MRSYASAEKNDEGMALKILTRAEDMPDAQEKLLNLRLIDSFPVVKLCQQQGSLNQTGAVYRLMGRVHIAGNGPDPSDYRNPSRHQTTGPRLDRGIDDHPAEVEGDNGEMLRVGQI